LDKITATCIWLDEQKVDYQLITHQAVFTIDDMRALSLDQHGIICKNLFLRDEKGRRHLLVVVSPLKVVDLKALGATIGVRLSFASEDRLARYLNLAKGSVTPLGVLFDTSSTVEILMDRDLEGNLVGVHPCENTATVFMAFADLMRILQQHGNPVSLINF
jgi:Ala-tRNA(Pro) deacylase